MSNLSRQVGLRLFVCFGALLSGGLGLYDPWAMYPGVLQAGAVKFLSWAVTILALGGLSDLVSNDTRWGRKALPEFGWVLRAWRDAGYLSVASAHACLLFLIARSDSYSPPHLEFGLTIAACVWIAVMDVTYLIAPPRPPEDR
jgi:hypothetical protein